MKLGTQEVKKDHIGTLFCPVRFHGCLLLSSLRSSLKYFHFDCKSMDKYAEHSNMAAKQQDLSILILAMFQQCLARGQEKTAQHHGESRVDVPRK